MEVQSENKVTSTTTDVQRLEHTYVVWAMVKQQRDLQADMSQTYVT